ncbi:hypothetical protein [Marinagarivorans cellulosilyticus]|nr:hypothetical protein [Marinagarivorans cellulosilyticus]
MYIHCICIVWHLLFVMLDCTISILDLSDMASTTGKKQAKKDSQLIIRINTKERDEFVALCESLDTSAAREIRRFIRTFQKEHGGN